VKFTFIIEASIPYFCFYTGLNLINALRDVDEYGNERQAILYEFCETYLKVILKGRSSCQKFTKKLNKVFSFRKVIFIYKTNIIKLWLFLIQLI
jgi:hypothetical protein